MLLVFELLVRFVWNLFRSAATISAENIALRHQLAVERREPRARIRLRPIDRWLWGQVFVRWSGWRRALLIASPATVVAWHRAGFRVFWRLRSRSGRKRTDGEIRKLVRRMANENPTWGAPRIHGELRRIGFRVSERTVSRLLGRIRPRPMERGTQTWKTFLENQAKGIVCADLFAIPTARFRILYGFVLLSLDRRRIVGAGVTAHPSAAWLSQQVRNAFPDDTAPRFLVRDNDGAYGTEFSRTLERFGIEEVRTAPNTPKMNAHVERTIGSLRRECFDHVIVGNENHARRLLAEYIAYYNRDRTHLALAKDSPEGRPVEIPSEGKVVSLPRLGGLHHRYTRIAA